METLGPLCVIRRGAAAAFADGSVLSEAEERQRGQQYCRQRCGQDLRCEPAFFFGLGSCNASGILAEATLGFGRLQLRFPRITVHRDGGACVCDPERKAAQLTHKSRLDRCSPTVQLLFDSISTSSFRHIIISLLHSSLSSRPQHRERHQRPDRPRRIVCRQPAAAYLAHALIATSFLLPQRLHSDDV